MGTSVAKTQSSPTLRVVGITGAQVIAHFESLDPYAIGDVVSWPVPILPRCGLISRANTLNDGTISSTSETRSGSLV